MILTPVDGAIFRGRAETTMPGGSSTSVALVVVEMAASFPESA
jgi:hypothetical protein